jgi:hypothetical protein
MHDPRRSWPPSARDIGALTFIGEGYEVAQYQLHAAIFPNVSAVVVSHFVTRAMRNGWIAVERWNRVGINRLRLTGVGREAVIRAGGDPSSVFVPRRPVATKDVAHTLWINDVRVALRKSSASFDVILPAWQLQRRMTPAPAAIPDVLAIRRGGEQAPSLVFAAEIDLGGERLLRTFLPKLEKLHRLVLDWSGGAESTILVLTPGTQRVSAINDFASSERLSVVAASLPAESGVSGMRSVAALVARVLGRDVKSN